MKSDAEDQNVSPLGKKRKLEKVQTVNSSYFHILSSATCLRSHRSHLGHDVVRSRTWDGRKDRRMFEWNMINVDPGINQHERPNIF